MTEVPSRYSNKNDMDKNKSSDFENYLETSTSPIKKGRRTYINSSSKKNSENNSIIIMNQANGLSESIN